MDTNPWIAIGVTVLLVAINGMLASAEIALVGLSEVRLRDHAASGDKKSRLLLNMKENPSNFLSTIQIGITLSGLLSGAFAADALAAPITAWAAARGVSGGALSLVGTLSEVFITLLLTYFMLVFGELVPKRVAMARPEETARKIISPIARLASVTKPIIKLLAASTNRVLKLVGIDPSEEEEAVTEDEILMMLKAGHQQGRIEATELEFVSNLFEMTDMKVYEAMTHRTEVETITLDTPLSQLGGLMRQTGHSVFPVCEESLDNIVGILYAKDTIRQYPAGGDKPLPKVADVMRPPLFVFENKPLVELFTDMRATKDRMAIVVDEYGGTAGVITFLDIIEQIVGDIESTFHDDIRESENGWLINGFADMEDVGGFLCIDPEEYDTLSGYVIGKLGYIPRQGQTPEVRSQGYLFRVAGLRGAAISSVQVQKLDQTSPS